MRRRSRVLAAVLGLAAVLVVAAPAGAHPLGNFTVNRYARVEVSAGALRVHYVLDEAEIPAFQRRGELAAGRDAFAAREVASIADGLRLTVDGVPVPVRAVASELTQPDGQGGLTTLRLVTTFEAVGVDLSRPSSRHRVTVEDANGPDRPGWRELVVVARGDARLFDSTAPARDQSDELRSYPGDSTSSALDLRAASFEFAPGSVAVAPSPLTRLEEATKRSGGAFTSLIERESVGPFVLLGLLAAAVGFGAAHALAPGHGKTVMAAYLVGTRGRPRDALLLGGVVSLMHTLSVLVLGLGLVALGHTVAPERIYPWLTVASGVTVTVVGAWLLHGRRQRVRARRSADARAAHHAHGHPAHDQHAHDQHAHDAVLHGRDGSHGHDHHAHAHADARGHDHSHGHEHGPRTHTHELPEGVTPLSRRGLLALGTSGGLFPSPSAVVVLVSAFSLHRPALGLALVAAFSVGLAATLSVVGLALVLGRSLADRGRGRRVLELLPVASACAITVAGVVVTFQGAHQVL